MSSHAARPAGPRVSAAWALRAAILCLAGLAITWVVAELVPTARTHDAAALSGFTQLSGHQGLANHVAHLVDPLPYAAFGCALIVLALARGRRRVAVAVLIVLVGAAFSAEQLKPLLAHAHAAAGGHRIEADSWPSGHATAAMALALCAVLAAPRRLRPAAAVVGGLFAVAVSFALLTLAWHLPSDVVGGYLVAAVWTALAVAALRGAEARWPVSDLRGPVSRAGKALRSRAAPVAAGLAVVGAALALVVIALRAHQLAVFADGHRSLVVAAGAIAALAGVLVSGLAAELRR